MKVTQENYDNKGRFLIKDGDTIASEMTYSWAGKDKFIIDHTEVDPAYGGKGYGKAMVLEAVNYARENNLKILPLCPYAKSVFDKDPALSDVLFGR